MVNKRDLRRRRPKQSAPDGATRGGRPLAIPQDLDTSRLRFGAWRAARISSTIIQVGERIDHVDGMTIEEAEHQIATRLYQNTAKGHFDAVHAETEPVRARSSMAVTSSRWRVPCPSTVSPMAACWPPSMEDATSIRRPAATRSIAGRRSWRNPTPPRADIGALRVRTVATKDVGCSAFPAPGEKGDPSVLLDLDYWLLMPRAVS